MDNVDMMSIGLTDGVQMQQLLTALVHNATLSHQEQQVVLHESSTPPARQWQTLCHIVCSKGLTAMDTFVRILKLHQQFHQQHKLNNNNLTLAPQHQFPLINNNNNEQTSLIVDEKNVATAGSLSSSAYQSSSSSNEMSGHPSPTTNTTQPSLQDEINKVLHEKFGLAGNALGVTTSGSHFSDCAKSAGCHIDLPPVHNGYPTKSPKLPNRNVDMTGTLSALMNSGPTCMESQNTNKPTNLPNRITDVMDGGGGAAATASTSELMNEDSDQWEFHEVTLTKMQPYGFGIAVSGGRDNPHFANGDPSIAVSDVLKSGPAEGRLIINDRIINVNGISLENVDYSYAVSILKECPPTVQLVVKRRASLHTPTTPNASSNRFASYSVILPKPVSNSKRKDDFGGLVFGCILYVKDITNRSLADVHGIQVGDTVMRIGATPVDHLTFHEVKKVLEKRPKDKHCMVFQRSRGAGARSALAAQNLLLPMAAATSADPNTPPINHHRRQSSQNVYTELPTKTDNHVRQKSADSTDGRLINSSRAVHGIRSTSMNLNTAKAESVSSPLATQRISAPILAENKSSSATTASGTLSLGSSSSAHVAQCQLQQSQVNKSATMESSHDCISLSSDWRFPDPRFVSFRKDGSVGLRLTGGNEAGIFVAAAQSGSPAAMAGLTPGDKILKVNDKDMKGVTREEAVLFLLNLSEQIEMVVQQRKQEFDYVLANLIGDSFYIRTHFLYEPENKNDLSFQPGDTFRVLDTLHTGSVGSWFVTKIGANKLECGRGSIPSASRADEMAKNARSGLKANGKLYSNTLADRLRRRSRRSKSLTKEQWEEVAYGRVESHFPAYERIVLKMPHFQRPIIFYGPLADIAREKLVREFPDRFACPQMDAFGGAGGGDEKCSGIVRLSVLRQIMAQNKHCVLDLTCQAVDRLNYAQMYPMVIFIKSDSKDLLKEIRSASSESKRKSTKKLMLESQKLEKSAGFLLTGLVAVKNKTNWFRAVCEMVEQQQQSPIWMSDKPPDNPLTDDFLFPMATSAQSLYSSGPDSDAENLYDIAPVPPPRRVSRDDSNLNRSPAALTNLTNGQANNESVYMPRPSAGFAAGDFREPRHGFSKKTEDEERNNNVNIFATLRPTPKLLPSNSTSSSSVNCSSSNLPRRPRPPPITLPSHSDDRLTGKPSQSQSFLDIPASLSNGTPSTSGTYEDPKLYTSGGYGFSSGSSHGSILTTRTLDRHTPARHQRCSPKLAPDYAHSSALPAAVVGQMRLSPNKTPASVLDGHSPHGMSRHHPPATIKEETAPPLPPKPKYLTNGRLKMFQNGTTGIPPTVPHAGYSERSQAESTYGKLPARQTVQKCTARPIYMDCHSKSNGVLRGHFDFPFADEERGFSPSQFPPPPDDFLSSPKKLHPPEVIAEVRGYFDHNGGILTSEETGVTLIIPAGALANGVRQEIYFKVCREDNILSTLDKEKGERLLSPCVLCGPSGLTFLKPLELKLPHSANATTSPFGLISPQSSQTEYDKPKMSPRNASVSVYVDHF